jgi:hypothetical protein
MALTTKLDEAEKRLKLLVDHLIERHRYIPRATDTPPAKKHTKANAGGNGAASNGANGITNGGVIDGANGRTNGWTSGPASGKASVSAGSTACAENTPCHPAAGSQRRPTANTSASSGANERAQHVARLDFLTTAARHREAEAQ